MIDLDLVCYLNKATIYFYLHDNDLLYTLSSVLMHTFTLVYNGGHTQTRVSPLKLYLVSVNVDEEHLS